MTKVGVGRSIAHAYTFLFGRFFQIIGTAWLPALLYGLGSYALLSNMAGWLPPHGVDPLTTAKALALALGVAGAAAMIRSVLGISLTQEALGVRKDLTLAHFVIGPRELRLFFGYVRLFVAYIALYAIVLAIIIGAAFLARQYGGKLPANLAVQGIPAARIAVGVLAVVLIIWMVLLVLRVAFILAPVASVEHKVRLRHAMDITGGSGWRVLIVLICVVVPVVAIAYGVFYALYPNDITNLMQQLSRLKPGQAPDFASFYAAHAGIVALIGSVVTVVNSAMMAGASATAYRDVTGHEDPETEDDAALVAPLLGAAAAEEAVAAGHDSHGDQGHGHDDHGHGRDDHGHGHDDHGHGNGHGHDDHGHGHGDHGNGHGHDDHGHGNGHGDHGHGGHDDHGHAEQAHGDGHGNGHGDHGHGNGHGDDGHGHDDHGHGDHGHNDGHGHGGHGHGDHGHDDHGHHGNGHHHHAQAA